MKYDYSKMSDDDISELYLDVFGHSFAVGWDDHSDHRQEMIDCIESGVPQDMLTVRGCDCSGGVPGVDFAL